nr:hypothetical protein [Tanacetum cinerariifolium]
MNSGPCTRRWRDGGGGREDRKTVKVMGCTIKSLKSVLTQPVLDALCENYHIHGAVHPQLHGRHDKIRNSHTDKIGVYSRYFYFANYRIPLSEFLVEMDLFAFIRHTDLTKVKGAVNDDVNERVNDVAKAGQAERGDRVMDIRGIEIVANDEIQAIEADQPKKIKTKRKVTDGAGGSVYPPKKLREDYGTSCDAEASVARKSLVTLQGLFERITLAAEVGVTTAATVPFAASFVTPTPEHKGGGGRDSTTGPINHTRTAMERFVVLTYFSYYSGTNAADEEVNSIVRSSVPPPLILTVAVTTTVVPGAIFVLIHDLGVGQVNPSIFRDSASPTMGEEDVAGLSWPVGTGLSAGSFYISQYMDVETLRQLDRLKERDTDIASLKAQLSLKEAEAAEAIRLSSQIAAVEAAEATRIKKLNSLRERNVSLEGQVVALESAVVSGLEVTCSGPRDEVMGEAIGRAIDKGMQDGLTAGIKHGRAERSIADVAAFIPFVEGDYVAAINALRDVNFPLLTQLEANKDSSMADIMDLLRLEEVSHNRVQRFRRDTTAHRLSLTYSILPFMEPLSAKNLTGEASSSAVLATAVTTALLTTFAQTDPVPLVLST